MCMVIGVWTCVRSAISGSLYDQRCVYVLEYDHRCMDVCVIKCQWMCTRLVVCGRMYDYMFGSKCLYSAVCGRMYD